MKPATIVRIGVGGGVLAALAVATTGDVLGFTLPPWNWSSKAGGALGHALQWGRAAAALAPIAVVLGTGVAFACAVVFEFVTRRSGWLLGAIVGVFLGVIGASSAGLVPWLASAYGYAYMPDLAPLGRHDPTWPLVALVGAAVLVGSIAGAAYGVPARATRVPRAIRWRQVYPPSHDRM